MNIQVLSDLHLEFEGFEVDCSGSDVVVLAGDIHVGDKGVKWALNSIRDAPVIYVLGNHEYYGCIYPKLVREVKEIAKGTNVYVLENESIKIGSVVFHGCTLWTDFKLFGVPRMAGYECQQRMTDFKKIRREPSYSKVRSLDIALINKNSVDWLGSLCDMTDGATHVVVTHHAPSCSRSPSSTRQILLALLTHQI